jgi:hypothetical protein
MGRKIVPSTQYPVLSCRCVRRTRYYPLRTVYSVLCTRYSLLPIIASCLFATSSALAVEPVTTNLGVEGVYYFRWNGPALEAAPVDDDAAVVLRIAGVTREGDGAIYELRYIGSLAGRHDLQKLLRRVDGQPLADIDPIIVAISNVLPEDHDGELEDRSVAGVARAWRYRLLLAAAALLWAVPIVWLIVRRITRRRVLPAIILEESPLTLADQLRPLVEAAIDGRLSTLEQARLERMLIAYWRERLDLASCSIDEAVARMRQHPPSAALLGKLEEWLHQRPRGRMVDVSEILRPYRDHAPLDRNALDRELVAEEISP